MNPIGALRGSASALNRRRRKACSSQRPRRIGLSRRRSHTVHSRGWVGAGRCHASHLWVHLRGLEWFDHQEGRRIAPPSTFKRKACRCWPDHGIRPARAAPDIVVAVAAKHDVVAFLALEAIVSVAAVDRVVPEAGLDGVRHRPANAEGVRNPDCKRHPVEVDPPSPPRFANSSAL